MKPSVPGVASGAPRGLTGWLFHGGEDGRSLWAIILWWEKRRIVYNLFILATTAVSLSAFYVAIMSSGQLGPGEDPVEPVALLAGPLLANVFYTGGWLFEGAYRLLTGRSPGRLGPLLLKCGFAFSAFVIFLPSVFWVTYRLLQVVDVVR